MMFRRRLRLFLFAALVIVILLYRISQNSGGGQPLQPVAAKQPQRPVETPLSNTKQPDKVGRGGSSARPRDSKRPAPNGKDEKTGGGAKISTHPDHGGAGADQKQPLSSKTDAEGRPKKDTHGGIVSTHPDHGGAGADQKQPLSSKTGAEGRPKKDTHGGIDFPLQHEKEKPLGQTGDARPQKPLVDEGPPRITPTRGSWTKPKEHFPLPKESIITLPAGSAKKIPKIQHDFPTEAEGPKKKRLQRLAMVKEEIGRSWAGYREYAWMHDELSPVSNRSRDPFCGWAATLVDSLDTLWIAGFKDEFDEAAAAVRKIDFTYTDRSTIPVFETTIRYLGGLLAAFDVSGGASGKYTFLLDKAVELAEVLMGIFDTPNRMPIMYYDWRPESAAKRHRAGQAGLAELATLTMEFTRLAQVTGQHKYFDAVDRITNGLVDLQRSGTLIPGLFPENLDVSGCNTTATAERRLKSKTSETRGDLEPPDDDDNWDCVPQGFVPEGWRQTYHMGGGQDSAYEYFAKVGVIQRLLSIA
ncbi:hypothetical protein E4U53_006730 [Claviceps sorghi]|nr:hypothetical protein E4U53_006730 [Claviceps sorghi]